MRVLALCLTFAILAGASGCGGSDQTASFKRAYRPLNDRVRTLGTEVGVAVQTARGKTDAALSAQFGSLATRLEGLRASLLALRPPPAYRGDVSALSTGMQKSVGDLRAIATAAAGHSAAAAKSAAQALAVDAVSVRGPRASLARRTGARGGG